MSFSWIKGNNLSKIATIYSNNITFNTSCLEDFNNIHWCLIGIDRETKKIAVKTVTDEEINMQKYIPEILNKLYIGKSYIRLSNKHIITEIRKMINIKDNKENIKCFTNFDYANKQFIIDLNKDII